SPVEVGGVEHPVTGVDMALYSAYLRATTDDPAYSKMTSAKQKEHRRALIGYLSLLETTFSQVQEKRLSLSEEGLNSLQLYELQPISKISEDLQKAKLDDEKGEILRTLGLKALNEAHDLDLQVAYYNCAAEKYY